MYEKILKLASSNPPSSNTSHRSKRTFFLFLVPVVFLLACSKNVNDPGYEFQIGVGEQFVRSGEYDRGFRILENVAENNPDAASVQIALAESYFDQGAFLKARSHYDRAIQLGEADKGHLGNARVALAQNDAELALQLFGILMEKNQSVAVLNGVGVAYDILGQHETAQNYYEQVLTHDADNIPALNNLALSQTLSGNRIEGDRLFTNLFPSALNNSTVRQNTAFVKALNGDTKGALDLFSSDLDDQKVYHNINVAERLKSAL
ncbi:tetratricopeptide repeat protein [uncultured Roseibium sp.]|uniref:tetratricopeptide repeat protein n=1 Tax=uncultured Roseibium sp. TaxID=1936171 RepID=UPI002623971F|nr:tetratricopeptide repeat protein [uncultured Roseibium sp.]